MAALPEDTLEHVTDAVCALAYVESLTPQEIQQAILALDQAWPMEHDAARAALAQVWGASVETNIWRANSCRRACHSTSASATQSTRRVAAAPRLAVEGRAAREGRGANDSRGIL